MIPAHVRPWSSCDPRTLAAMRGVLTDIDDTLTTAGVIPPEVVGAIAALRDSGVPVIAVTGRPMGWSLPIAASTPLAAVVAENGAVALVADRSARNGVRVDYADDEATRAANAVRLRRVAERIVREIPGATTSRDSVGRVTDIAIDHHEHVHLAPAQIDRVVALMREEGMNATVSSIHINGWFGAHSKLSGARWIVRALLGRDLDLERERWLYVGDSTNDEPMFEAFPSSIGVANLADFAARLRVWPAFITDGERGRGFVEVVEALLASRAAAARTLPPPMVSADPLLIDAIRARRRLRFVYDGKARLAEPQCYGVGRKGTELLRVLQLRGGAQPEPLFDVAKIERLEVLDDTFDRPGPNYKRDDSAMETIFAQL